MNKRTFTTIVLLCTLILVVPHAKAQTSEPLSWSTYTLKGADFSVALPSLPAVQIRREKLQQSQKERQRHVLKFASKEIIYLIQVLENPEPRLSLETFIQEQIAKNPGGNLTPEKDLTVDGIAGKSFLYSDGTGMVQFFADAKRLYEFRAFGAPVDDARMAKFFSSLSLKKKKGSIEVSESVQSFDNEPPQNIHTGKDVTSKARILNKPDPDSAGEGTGVVILRCVFASNGTVTNIRVIEGVPGLTEKAIEAARQIKFVPATKYGVPVSMWMQLEYHFDKFFVRD